MFQRSGCLTGGPGRRRGGSPARRQVGRVGRGADESAVRVAPSPRADGATPHHGRTTGSWNRADTGPPAGHDGRDGGHVRRRSRDLPQGARAAGSGGADGDRVPRAAAGDRHRGGAHAAHGDRVAPRFRRRRAGRPARGGCWRCCWCPPGRAARPRSPPRPRPSGGWPPTPCQGWPPGCTAPRSPSGRRSPTHWPGCSSTGPGPRLRSVPPRSSPLRSPCWPGARAGRLRQRHRMRARGFGYLRRWPLITATLPPPASR